MGDLAGLLDPLIATAISLDGAFVEIGRVMLALALTLSILFSVYSWWLGDVAGASARLARAALVFIVPFTLLTGDHWKTTMGATTHFFTASLTRPVLGSTSGADTVKNAIDKISKSMFPNARKPDAQKPSTWEQVRAVMSGEQSVGGALFSALTEAFFEVVLFAIALFFSIALVFALYGPMLALHVGAIFGPLLIAWMPFPPLAHLARSWLSFMLAQGLAVVVGVTLAVICASVVESYTASMVVMGHDPALPWYEELAAKIGGFMSSSAVILFVAWMLFKADDIAAALVGSGGVGSGGIGAVIVNKISSARLPKKPEKPEK